MVQDIWDKIESDLKEQYGEDRAYKEMMLVAGNIGRIMKLKGLSSSQLAEKMGKLKTWISRCLSGNENMTIETIVSFAEALEVETYVLWKPYVTEEEQREMIQQNSEHKAIPQYSKIFGQISVHLSQRTRSADSATFVNNMFHAIYNSTNLKGKSTLEENTKTDKPIEFSEC